ncbi:histidine kinase [Chitinophaga sp. Mgbs1]|uniref:Histidine kinase n=1 Tax=Chitinophaga solisilvae TaxID=1233460 RepID=A0A3S1CYA1_9BACT|nr:histidine kinase [Chitinophaga solisilvae]
MHKTRQFLLLMLLWMLLLYGIALATAANFSPAGLRRMHVNTGVFGLLNFLQCYVFYRWIIPPFLTGRRWQLLLLKTSAVFTCFTLIKYFISRYIFLAETLHLGHRYDPVQHKRIELYQSFGEFIQSDFWVNVIILAGAFAVHFFLLWLEEDKRRAQLQQQQLQAESGFLKMQLNSHFLINSLNSIYSLALAGSPEVVTANKTLTQLLAYMVEQPTDVDYRSPLREEINYLLDFVRLHRLRTGCDSCVVFGIPETLPDKHIAPMLLVPFVENAFKHGIANQPEKPVRITLAYEDRQLVFSVRNYKSTYHRDKTGGIGLDNVRKRLQLLYPDQHQLRITDTETEYCCTLAVNL